MTTYRCEVPMPRKLPTLPTREDYRLALHKLDARLDEITEEILTLSEQAPGDPGITRWPPGVARDLERLLDEQDLAIQQAKMLRRILGR